MDQQAEIRTKVEDIFKDQFGGEAIDWQRSWSDYNFSSIQLVYFLKDLEGTFGPIPIEEFYDLTNGRDLVDYLSKRLLT
jgi:acyl carrier protein